MTLSRTTTMMILAAAVALAACNRSRQTTRLPYGGDNKATLAPLESEITAQGYKATCKEGEYCHFMIGQDVRVHYKVGGRDVVLAVDVLNAKEMPPAKVAELTANGEKVGRAIWEKARVAAEQRERDAKAAEARRIEEEARVARAEAAREAEEEKNKPASSGVSFNDVMNVMNKVQVGVGPGGGAAPAGGATAGGGASGEASCCVNGAFYLCPDAAAVHKCGGETAACMSKCMSSSDMKCPDRCMAEHPPDPSSCKREPGRDGQCK